MGSFLLSYMRISRSKKDCVEKAACFLTEIASGECVTLSVVNKPGWMG